MPESYLDRVVKAYIGKFKNNVTDQRELADITKAIKNQILANALSEIKRREFNEARSDARKKAKEEAMLYKKGLLRRVRISIILDTMIIAFLVGILVNQFTNVILGEPYSMPAIIIALLVCTIMVILAAWTSRK